MRSANLRPRLWVPLVWLCLALVATGVSADQTCKYDSIPATALASRFTDNGDGTVTDKATGLQWQRCSQGQTWSGGTCTGIATVGGWQWALQRADVASYAGRSDWRLPSIKELASIVERACDSPAIDLAVFPATPFTGDRTAYWSSSPVAGGARIVGFGAGGMGGNSVNTWQAFRLVRGGYDSGPLNDTGTDWWGDHTANVLASPPADYPGQDASYGRDATQDNDADGHAGFSFTKLDANGNALAASAGAWSCVRDNVTGLTWEVKTDDGGLRDKDWTYTWYNPDPATNGGSSGRPDPGTGEENYANSNSCQDPARCDTAKFVADVNQASLCGDGDWRLPTVEELLSIVD
ncbi:MAG: DUF1566 domain-containing protein, partial [Chromatiaceae bacterium]|nr:DUF1566 domain-containing protein [Chromatiaceae bacterium]